MSKYLELRNISHSIGRRYLKYVLQPILFTFCKYEFFRSGVLLKNMIIVCRKSGYLKYDKQKQVIIKKIKKLILINSMLNFRLTINCTMFTLCASNVSVLFVWRRTFRQHRWPRQTKSLGRGLSILIFNKPRLVEYNLSNHINVSVLCWVRYYMFSLMMSTVLTKHLSLRRKIDKVKIIN